VRFGPKIGQNVPILSRGGVFFQKEGPKPTKVSNWGGFGPEIGQKCAKIVRKKIF
jgi:hypothetical protein